MHEVNQPDLRYTRPRVQRKFLATIIAKRGVCNFDDQEQICDQ